MSTSNGTAPPELVSIAMLREANTKLVPLPMLSVKLGREVAVRIRPIRGSAYRMMLPPPVPGAADWSTSPDWPADPEEQIREQERRTRAWLATLPESERQREEATRAAVTCKVIVAGVAEPAMTLDDARALGDDAEVLAYEILQLSGFIRAAGGTAADADPTEKVETAAEAPPA